LKTSPELRFWPGPWRAGAFGALLLANACGLRSTLVMADSENMQDHDKARSALRRGEILPLGKVLETVARTHPGSVLEVELDREHGRWIYEVKILEDDGALRDVEVDARTGLDIEQRGSGSGSD